jgi:general secretion pathway protein G
VAPARRIGKNENRLLPQRVSKKDFQAMSHNHRNAFSLPEIIAMIFIVVIVIATILPHVFSPNAVATDDFLRYNLHSLRMQIETYRNDHAGKAPTLANFLDQMTLPTNAAGATSGKILSFGPYLASGQIPVNPFNNSNLVVSVAKPGQPPTAIVPGNAGWQYDQTTGIIYPNNPEYYSTHVWDGKTTK